MHGGPAAHERRGRACRGAVRELGLAADQNAEDVITDKQLQRITARMRPELEAEQAKLRTAQPSTELAEYAGPGVIAAWDQADVETRKQIIRLLGMRITVNRFGLGNGAS